MYFRGKDHCFPINSRVMSSAIAESIVRKDYPVRAATLLDIGPFTFKTLVDYVDTPDLPCLMLVREPLERVQSALGMSGVEVDSVIEGLKSKEEFFNSVHFHRQSDFVHYVEAAGQTLTCFRFPDQIHLFQEAAGFVTPFLTLNESVYKKPEFSKEQEDFFKEYYAEDISLYNSL